MWQNRLKELIYILEHSDINEIEANFWGRKYRVVKNPPVVDPAPVVAPQETQPEPDTLVPQPAAGGNSQLAEVRSPMPGTFYCAPSPKEPPFVRVGDLVKKGDPLCIVEAMKIMNEIETSVNGVVREVLVENGNPVEYNQPLFLIE